MSNSVRPFRCVLAVLVLVVALAAAPTTPRAVAWAGSSAQPGEVDVGSAPVLLVPAWAGSSAQPGEVDPG